MMISQPDQATESQDKLGMLLFLLLIIWAAVIVHAMYGVFVWRRGSSPPPTLPLAKPLRPTDHFNAVYTIIHWFLRFIAR